MDKQELLFEDVIPKNHSIGSYYIDNKIRIKDKYFNIKSIFKIIEHINWLKENTSNANVKILIESECISDEVIVLVFESVIYHSLKYFNINIKYRFELLRNTLGYYFYLNSLLNKYNNMSIDKEKYIKDYENDCIIYGNHFRKRCSKNDDKNNLSITMDEISSFFKNLLLEEDYSDELSEVIIEIIGNAVEHSGSTCISNINVLKRKNGDKVIDIAIVDYSKVFLGTGIEQYIECSDKDAYNERNKIVLEAYDMHKEHFSEEYKLCDFSLISAFQKNVSSRKFSSATGGTGLTTLIKALINKSIANYCYVSSGETILFFKKDFLELTEDGLIGFNEKNDYMQEIPNSDILQRNKYNKYINAYNLQFIFKEKI